MATWAQSLERVRGTLQPLWSSYKELNSHDIAGLSAEFAYYFLFSLFPQLLFLISLLSHIFTAPQTMAAVSILLNSVFPVQVVALIEADVALWITSNSFTTISLSLLVYLWAGSNVFRVMLKGFNRMHPGKEKYSAWRIRVFSTLLVLFISVGFSLVFILNLFGRQLRTLLISFAPNLSKMILFNRIELLGTPLVLFVLAYSLYRFIPAERPRKIPTAIAATFFTAATMIATALFRFYTQHSSVISFYGGLTAAMLSLLWMYFLGYLLFLGAEINAVLLRKDHQVERQEKELSELSKDPA